MLEGMQIDILKALVALCQASTKLNKMTWSGANDMIDAALRSDDM